MQPNLFQFATKELSQDAFIAWLASWASPKHQSSNESLHLAAQDFLQTLLLQQHPEKITIESVKVKRQEKNIDVWIEVNRKHLIIIEDKVGTGRHSGQLKRYKDIGEEWCKDNQAQLTCIYLKTHSETLESLNEVKKEGYAVFLRHDFLKVLSRYKVGNDIYQDFQNHFQAIEDEENKYLTLSPSEWEYPQWAGFYRAAEQRGSIQSWSHVNNISGGFLNAIIGGTKTINDKAIYMQIEQGNLCIKICEIYKNEGQAHIRNKTHEFLMEHQDSSLPLQRPQNFGAGKYMTVAIVPLDEWVVTNSANLVDVAISCHKLDSYKSWLINTVDTKYPLLS